METLDPNDTVFESIQKVSPSWSETQMRTYLGSFMFTGDEIEKYIKVLSGGEKARIAMARMLVEPSHILLLDEPTNHLDIMTRNIVETALKQFTGSIVCISHDRHFLNKVTNLICEVDSGGIRMFEGNYDYYIWKKDSESLDKPKPIKKKITRKGKLDYQQRKKTRNRLSWIEKKFKTIELELDTQRKITQNSTNADNYELLQKAMEKMNELESEYLDLMMELEYLLS